MKHITKNNIPDAVYIDRCGDLATTIVALVDLIYGGRAG